MSPANGKPIIVPSQDIVLGLYYLSLERDDHVGPLVSIDSAAAMKAALDGADIMLRDAKNRAKVVELDDAKAAFKALKAGEITSHRIPVFGTIGEDRHCARC